MKGDGAGDTRVLRIGSVWLRSSGKLPVPLAAYLKGFRWWRWGQLRAQHLHGMNIYTIYIYLHLEKAELMAIGTSTRHPEG